MAKYETDFSEYTVGALPAGWIAHGWHDTTLTAVTAATWLYKLSNNMLRIVGNSSNRPAGIYQTILGSSDAEQLILGGDPHVTGVYYNRIGATLRQTWTDGNYQSTYTGYVAQYENIYRKVNSISGTILASNPVAAMPSGHHAPSWLRLKIVGTTLQAKRWAYSNIEPPAWQMEITDSVIPAGAGLTRPGVYCYYPLGGSCDTFYYGIATAGESLPVPDSYNGDVYFGTQGDPTGNASVAATGHMEGGLIGAGYYLQGVRLYIPTTGKYRVALYVGGALDDPTGAQLLCDLGEATIGATGWQTIASPVMLIPAGNIWMVVRGPGSVSVQDYRNSTWNGGAWYAGQWQQGRDYYVWGTAETNTTVAYPANVPAGGSFDTGNRSLLYKILVAPSSHAGLILPRTAAYTDSYTLSDSTRVSIQEPYFFYEDLATFKSQLANRLNDPDMVYWTSDELLTIVHEALRTLSLLTWYNGYRLDCTPTGAFQNLYTIDPQRLGATVTDREMINRMQYDLMENITADWISGWNGTEQFNLADLTHALQKRRNRFLGETGAVITRITNGDITLTNDGIIKIPDSIIDVRRVAWKDSTGYRNLWRAAEEELTAYDPSWTPPAAQDPLYYSELAIKQSHMQLAPAPSALNDMELLTLSAGADFQPSLEPTAVGINDDMTWILKWGALAEVLGGDNPAKDPERAAYCEKRYQHGIEMANNYTTILAARIGTAPIQVVTLAELDAYNGDWQKATAGAPQMVATAGLNYVAFSPPADGSTAISLDITRTAQLPWGDSDFIQLGRELYSPVLDYCVHLAMFKVGGAEFQATMPLLENFFEMCSNYNKRMEACSRLWKDMDKITNAEEMTRLRMKTAGEPRTPENWGAGKPGGRQ